MQTSAFAEARAILARESVCIVAGPPGIGKTTLAHMLLLDAIEHEHQPYEIVHGALGEAWDCLALDEPQIFLFDDFLGETFLDPGRTRDAELLRFVRDVRRRPGKRLILTTREYILRDAEQVSERLARDGDPALQCFLRPPDMTRRDRARIFFNHVWFSPHLNAEARASLVADRGYERVIDHPDFNPRVIGWVCGRGAAALTASQLQDFTGVCLKALDNPDELWTHAFARGISDAERALLLAFPGLPERVPVDMLARAFDASRAVRPSGPNRRFRDALRVLDGSFVATAHDGDGIVVSLANPSLLDFLRRWIGGDARECRDALAAAAYFEQVVWLFGALGGLHRAPGSVSDEDFAAALGRTFDSPVTSTARRYSVRELAAGDILVERHDRIGFVLERGPRSATFRRAALRWLPAQASAWLAELTPARIFFHDGLPTLHALVEWGALERLAAARRTLAVADGNTNRFAELHEYEALLSVRELAPELFAARLPQARDRFAAFAQDALGTLGLYVDDGEDLAALVAVAQGLSVELPKDLVEGAWDWAAEVEAAEQAEAVRSEAPWEHDDYGLTSGQDADDPEIDSMFRTLTD